MSTVIDLPRLVLVLSLVLLMASAAAGVYVERRVRPLKAGERETFSVVLGGTLTLLGLIIGFSFSMAISRYDLRKDYEAAEANAIGTEFLRTDLLPPAKTAEAKDLLRRYLSYRIRFYEERHEATLAGLARETDLLQQQIWALVRSSARAEPTPIAALVTAGMNEVIDAEGRTQAAWWNRIPEGAWLLMGLMASCSCFLTGYSAHRARRWLLVVLPMVLSVALFSVADIDSPRHGVIRVVPHNLIDLQQSLQVD